jgi:hypothetical protein
MDDTTLEAIWCWDSETGKKYLLDVKTGKVIYDETSSLPPHD